MSAPIDGASDEVSKEFRSCSFESGINVSGVGSFFTCSITFQPLPGGHLVLEKNEHPKELQVKSSELEVTDTAAAKKAFVEPEISVPVDVLEVTTFLQAVTSGSTN